jgi:hypothetical protein
VFTCLKKKAAEEEKRIKFLYLEFLRKIERFRGRKNGYF